MENLQKQLIITGATGMVGEGVLHEAINSPFVSQILVVNRKPCGVQHPNVKEYLLVDFMKPEDMRNAIKGYDACLFCLGVSSVGMKPDAYKQKTYDLTLGFAKVLHEENPQMSFSYISGAGTDSTEQGRLAWARVKGKTENDLAKLGFGDYYSFRPAMIRPTPGLKNALSFYKYLDWIFPILKWLAPHTACTLEELGHAMLETSIFGSPIKTVEGNDILALAKQMRARL
jgi:uncharacterized protein YbjT (DUF2867 family)